MITRVPKWDWAAEYAALDPADAVEVRAFWADADDHIGRTRVPHLTSAEWARRFPTEFTFDIPGGQGTLDLLYLDLGVPTTFTISFHLYPARSSYPRVGWHDAPTAVLREALPCLCDALLTVDRLALVGDLV